MKTQNRKVRFWLLYHLGMLIFSVIATLLLKYNQNGCGLDLTVFVALFTIFFTSTSIGYLTIYMVNKAAKYTHKQLTKRILPGLLIFYIASFLIANIMVTIGVFGWYLFTGMGFSNFISNLFHNDLSFANNSMIQWLLFFTIAFFYVLWNKSAKREQQLIEENLKYRYNTLKSQLNPHFLFNSLNTLSEIVYINAQKADNYIQQLSGVYRYILENEETDFIPLNKELEFVEQYFDLQKERDNGKIALKIECQHVEGYKIIPVSLQLLIENALKHNAMSEKNPLEIRIYCKDEYIVVSNTLQRKNTIENSTQTGLANLMERLKLMTGKEMIIKEENKLFKVMIPIIRA